jgi:GAF domain-containing protein/HAMP domain-containing protein
MIVSQRETQDSVPDTVHIEKIQKILFIPFTGILIGVGLFAYYYWQSQRWQFGLKSALLAVAILCILAGIETIKRRHVTTGEMLIILGLLLPYASAELLGKGITIFLLFGGTLLILSTSALMLQKRQLWGWIYLPLFMLFFWFVNSNEPLPRYEISAYPVLAGFMLTAIVAIVIVGIYQVVRSIDIATIRLRLASASILLVLIPISLLSFTSILLTQRVSRQQVETELTDTTNLAYAEIQAWFQSLTTNLVVELERNAETGSLTQLLESNSGTTTYEDASRIQRQRFINTIRLRRVFEELLVLDRNGTIILSTRPAQEGVLNPNQAYFQEGLRGPYVETRRTNSVANPVNVTVALPIIGSGDRPIGVIVGRSGLKGVNNILETKLSTGEIYLVGDDGILLTPIRADGAPTMGAEVKLESFIQEKNSGVYQYLNPANQDVLGTSVWIPELNAFLLAERGLTDVNLASNQIARLNILLATVLVALAIGAALLITRSIANPISALDKAAQKIAAGDFQSQVEVERKDEIGRLAFSFNQMTAQLQGLITDLEDRVQARTQEVEQRAAQIAAAAEVGNSITTIHNLDQLLTQVTYLISEKFNFYHAGIFLLDEKGEYAVLRAANSEGGKRMLARNHRLPVGQTGIVGYVTARREPRIALDVGLDAVFFNNPDLPDTRSEMALPLIARGELLGALDVQSQKAGAFTQDDVIVLQLLADQVAVAIQNAHLFTQSQQALEAARTAYGQLSQRAWLELLQSRSDMGYQSVQQTLKVAGGDLRPETFEAIQTGNLVQGNGNGYSLAIPIKIRDTVIGVIDTYKPLESGGWTEEELGAIKNITNQLGVTLESARLYEESQLQAETERLLSEISTHIRETLDVESVIQTASRDILKALGLAEVEIRLDVKKSAE